MFRTLETRVASLARGLALLGFAGLLTLAGLTTLDVLLRWLLAMPLAGVNDISASVMAVVIAACIPANLITRQNISVELLGPALGPRVHAGLSCFASLVTLLFVAVMAWKFIGYTEGLWAGQRRTWVLGWSLWPWWAAVTLLLGAAVLVQLLVLISDLSVLLRGRSDKPLDDAGDTWLL